MGSNKLEFGACCLTNLRFVFEESAWYRSMKTAAEFVPTQGDFGLTQLISGSEAILNNYFITRMGRQDKLGVVQQDSRLFIPLSSIRWMEMALQGSSFLTTLSNESRCGKRNIRIAASNGIAYFYEMYKLPPHKTGFMPDYISESWMQKIRQVQQDSYGTE